MEGWPRDTEEYEGHDASTGDTAEVGIDPMTAPLVEEEIVEPAGEMLLTYLLLGMALIGSLGSRLSDGIVVSSLSSAYVPLSQEEFRQVRKGIVIKLEEL
ncbi:hypothetical protein Tco_0071888 [Tanacetum coccineum]